MVSAGQELSNKGELTSVGLLLRLELILITFHGLIPSISKFAKHPVPGHVTLH